MTRTPSLRNASSASTSCAALVAAYTVSGRCSASSVEWQLALVMPPVLLARSPRSAPPGRARRPAVRTRTSPRSCAAPTTFTSAAAPGSPLAPGTELMPARWNTAVRRRDIETHDGRRRCVAHRRAPSPRAACSSVDSSAAAAVGSTGVRPVTSCPASSRARTSHWPTNPAAPVTSARMSVAPRVRAVMRLPAGRAGAASRSASTIRYTRSLESSPSASTQAARAPWSDRPPGHRPRRAA